MLEGSICKQLDNRALQLTDTGSDIFRDKSDYIIRYGVFQMIDVRLLLENRNAVLKIGEINVRDHSPLESAYQTSFKSCYIRWCSIAGQNYLPASFIKSIERVEKLLLCCLFSL